MFKTTRDLLTGYQATLYHATSAVAAKKNSQDLEYIESFFERGYPILRRKQRCESAKLTKHYDRSVC